ncbi:hypothetical protein [Actinoplanes sp. G11-F43]|uniref:hypothetical protein n=1 Tax=Actinoplanes sp. G11-F43 TaxID=3424130 RepID=UPI003D32BF41
MTSDPVRVGILLDPDDDVTVTRTLLAFHDPATETFVMHPSATSRRPRDVAHDVLVALGAPAAALGAQGLARAGNAWAAVRAWVSAYRIDYLIVLRAHRFDADTWEHLIDLTRTTEISLLLVCHTPMVPAVLAATVRGVTCRVTDFAGLLQLADEQPALRPRRTRPQPRRRYGDLPAGLPVSQVMHYRADVYRRQPPEVFALVDELYGRGLDTACRWLQPPQRLAVGETTFAGERLQRLLAELVHDSPSRQHTLALLRGLQAGFLLHGHWLAIPNLANLAGPGTTSPPVTAETVARIRAGVAHPVLAAGLALALITGVDLAALQSLRLDALVAPMHQVRIPFDVGEVRGASKQRYAAGAPPRSVAVFYVAPAARPLLHAARAFLLARHPGDRGQRLFAGFDPVREHLEQAAAQCGLTLPAAPPDLVGYWPMRVRWSRHDRPVHTATPRHPAPGRSCMTAVTPAAYPVLAPAPYRYLHERVGKRWHDTGRSPGVVVHLVHAFLDGTAALRGSYQHTGRKRRLRVLEQDLIACHFAVRTPPVPFHDEVTVHPDIAFALRLTDRPAPAEARRPR